jgi:hypothetical protein
MLDEPGPIGDIYQRFLAGEISADNAARQIIGLLPSREIWALTIGSNLPGSRTVTEEEHEKASEFLLRIAELSKEIWGDPDPDR